MIDLAALRKKVLYLAIQGKLVEQRAEEGTAEELYKQIQAEKQKLIKEGKIKKEKPLPEISEKEIPFDTPNSWKWVRVGDLFEHNPGKAMNSSVKNIGKSGSIRKFITTSNVYWNKFDFTNVKEMFFSDDELERCTAKKGDLLICEGGAYYGRTAIWNYDYEICFQNHIHRLRQYKDLDRLFFYYVFYFYRNTNLIKSKGTAMPGLSSVVLHGLVVPLPPLAEQRRTVAKIDKIFAQIDIIDDLQSKYINDSAVLRNKILDAAIRGKLVEQRAEEGTAEELYKQIRTEKQKLIKEGKIKKEKPLDEIEDDEIPFDIPNSWKWVRWGDVVNIVSARRVHQSDWKKEGIPFYRAREIAEMSRTGGYIDNELFISEELYDEFSAFGVPKAGDIMVTAVGTLGKCYIVNDTDKFYYKDASVLCFENKYGMCSEFLAMMMQTPLMNTQIKSNSDGTTVSTLTMVRMADYLFPLPPLAEQRRIVAKIEELLPLCERLAECREKA